MKAHKIFALSALLLGLAMSLAACGDDEKDNPSKGSGGNSGSPSETPKPAEKPWSGPGKNPLAGRWSSFSSTTDWKFNEQTWSSEGGGATGSGYEFREDGTFWYYIISTGYGYGTMKGWVTERGHYKIVGDKIAYSHVYRNWHNSKDPSDSYENKPMDSYEEVFRIETYPDKPGETALILPNYEGSAEGSYSRYWLVQE